MRKRRKNPSRRGTTKNSYKKRRKYEYDDYEPSDNFISRLSPETKKGIFVIFLLVFGFLSFLGLFDLVGNLGRYITIGTSFVFGWLHFFIPIICIILSYMYLFPSKYNLNRRHYIGLILFLLSSTGILNLILDSENIFSALRDGKGGGYFGVILYYPFYELAGIWGALIILLGLLIISIMVMFDLSISDLNFINKLRESLRDRGSKRGLDEEEREKIIIDDIEQEQEIEKVPKENDMDKEIVEKRKMNLQIFSDSSEKKRKIYKDIKIPLDLLSDQKGMPVSHDIETSKDRIKKTFANFSMNVEMQEVHVGPTFTQFTLKPDENIRLSKILALQDNLALSLAAHPLRIEAPIPGKSLVGIEVPNKVISTVRIKEILSDSIFKKSDGHLVFALGKDVSGKNHIVDLVKMPHLLIAGATNSGKSVCVNSLIMSLLYKLNPNEIKFIMIDMKRVDLPQYNGIPHLLTPVITKIDKIKSALNWSVNEMEKRLDLLSKVNTVDIFQYNARVSQENRLPQIVIVIDELAELMQLARQEVENAVIRLAQMGRAPGIHLVLATQRPSVDVITGLIKANIPARIAFAVTSQIDSRTILDTSGAEKLLGRGDMLFICAEMSKPRRLQGAFVSAEDRERIVEFLKSQAEPDYLEEVTEGIESSIPGFSGKIKDKDPLLEEAKNIVIKHQTASATLFQRRLSVGYARAAKILDQLEQIGVVGPQNGPKRREVLLTEEDLENQEIAKFGSEGMYMDSVVEEEPENDDEDFPEEANSTSAKELISDAIKHTQEKDINEDEELEFDDEDDK